MRSLLALCALAIGGCSLPAKAIQYSYTHYNETIHYNQSQQMLLNLVRMKYRETPLFLKVSSLTTSYDLQVSADAGKTKTEDIDSWRFGVGSRLSTRPTISYAPVEGDIFVKRLLAEIDPDTFILLFRAGWPVKVLASVMVEKIGDYHNNEEEPTYPRFLSMIDALQEAQKKDKMAFMMKDDKLHVRVNSNRASLEERKGSGEDHELWLPFSDIQLRSLMDIMFFLGKNTEVPKRHLDQVRPSKTNGWISIHSNRLEPEDAMVWVRYKGYFFSIDDSDIKSKDTFALLKTLYQIQAGDIKTAQPVLTIPVAP